MLDKDADGERLKNIQPQSTVEQTIVEVLRNYLKRQDRKIDRLYTYAKMLRCEAIVRTYLEVLLS